MQISQYRNVFTLFTINSDRLRYFFTYACSEYFRLHRRVGFPFFTQITKQNHLTRTRRWTLSYRLYTYNLWWVLIAIYLMNRTTVGISRIYKWCKQSEKGVINKQIIILAQNPSPTFIIRRQYGLIPTEICRLNELLRFHYLPTLRHWTVDLLDDYKIPCILVLGPRERVTI